MNMLLALAAVTAASHAVVPPSPLFGTWAVDVTRLPMPPEARPKSVTFTFSDAGAGKWTTHVDIYGGDGSERHMSEEFEASATGTAPLPAEEAPPAE